MKGKWGEEVASQHLLAKGYDIIRRNFRSSYGEIDIIAFEKSTKTLIFVEVRLRKKGSLVTPLESIDWKKQERLKKTAEIFLTKFNLDYDFIRFDVIGITYRGRESFDIEHIKDAF
ncbi:MAG: YraN family protein [Desulfurobacteriaceae bacterium]